MAKRKFGASIIILCIAAVTLISGTYAWFLVGGFAELFDIGFDVMKAGAGIWVRGDALTHNGGKKDNGGWGDKLERNDFTEKSFILQDHRYIPISSKDGMDFIAIEMNNDKFKCEQTKVITKRSPTATPEDIVYNDFTLSIKSSGDAIFDGDAYMTIALGGCSYDDAGNKTEEGTGKGASEAARVAVTIDGVTKFYDSFGDSYNAVTQIFPDNTIVDYRDETDPDLVNGNYIIDDKDTGYKAAGLEPVVSNKLMTKNADDTYTLTRIPLGEIPSSDSTTGKDITVKIWLEGNDPQCISFGQGAIAGKGLTAKIEFNTVDK